MKLSDIINKKWLDSESLSDAYLQAKPFPHIVLHDFIDANLLKSVAEEFPDLAKQKSSVIKFENNREIKLASQGMQALTPSALHLNSYLQSDLMLHWLNKLTGIRETLISDPYLSGGGYHEIKTGGLLKVHADFNGHPQLNLDRRLNLLIYLNENWKTDWGGALQLFDQSMDKPIQEIYPQFNTAVVFTTTSQTYHGHPDPLSCPKNRSRRSLAYYYFSTGRPDSEVLKGNHSTLFVERKNESFGFSYYSKSFLREVTPPVVLKVVKKIFGK